MISQDEVIRVLFSSRIELLAFIRVYVFNTHVAEDIYQDVAVAALQKIEQIENERHLLFWARSVAKSYAIDYLRRQSRQPRHIDHSIIDLLEQDFTGVHANHVSKEIEALNACLKELTPRSKSLLKLKYHKEMNADQIASKLGIKIDSVYMAFCRIYRVMSECVKTKISQAQTG